MTSWPHWRKDQFLRALEALAEAQLVVEGAIALPQESESRQRFAAAFILFTVLSRRSAANRDLVDDIRRVHRDTRGRYGSPRIHVELKAQGRGASRGRIERLMRRHGIRAIMARPRRVRTTDSCHDFPIAPNLLKRNFIATAPNQIWLADIIYVETDQGWLYLATVLDLYSRKIVGWAMADHLRADLPLAALRMAISAQRPGAGLIHHSDRGVQYASADYRKLMQSAGLRASMSRKGDCYDNAPMQSFFHTLKTELVHHRHYATRAEATRDIFAYNATSLSQMVQAR